MEDVLILDVEEELVRKLELRAHANGRSPEEEVRVILRQALEEEDRTAASETVD